MNNILWSYTIFNIYKLAEHPTQALVHDSSRLSELWNRRFAHLHYRALPALKQMVLGVSDLPNGHQGVCMGCSLGKNSKHSFPSSDSRSKGILDLVHSNVCGPMTVESLGRFLYFTTFIDDFSRETWIYFLKGKYELFSKLKKFKAQVENSTNRKIKVLRSDNGGEYNLKDFNNFYRSMGIKREFFVPYNPQQNGVVEWKNQSIIESTKALIHDQGIPMFLEAANTIVYVQNRCPHKAVKDKTTEEAFTGVKPNAGHLRIFGCPVYIHVPHEKRSKLDPSGQKGIFIRYSETLKGYQVYVLGHRQIDISREVSFDENVVFMRYHESPAGADVEE